MLPMFACNLTAALSYPPWTEVLDWGLHTTMEWEKRVPFSAYVRRSPPSAARLLRQDSSLFPAFSKLPTELQLRILALCPANTLFQVMHVSLSLRLEASKLFWATPNASFLVDAYWLLVQGGYPGFTLGDPSFLHYVQNVELEYRPGVDSILCPPTDDESVLTRQDLIIGFWANFTQRFPSATRVVITQNWETPSWWDDGEPVAHPLRMLIQARPHGVQVAALVLERNVLLNGSVLAPPTQKWQRSQYQPTTSGGWAKAHTQWISTTLLMPPKPFNGPVGAFQRLSHDSARISYQEYGLWPIMIEAIDRHFFDQGRSVAFSCLFHGCNTYIARAGEWTVHVVEAHCQAWRVGEPLLPFLPDELRIGFEERVRVLHARRARIVEQYEKLREDWNEEGKQKRRETQRSWMAQLTYSGAWDTGKRAGESQLWRDFWQQMRLKGSYND